MWPTYLDEAVVEVQPEQRRAHAGFFGDGGSHGVLDDVQSVGAGFVIEFSRKLG